MAGVGKRVLVALVALMAIASAAETKLQLGPEIKMAQVGLWVRDLKRPAECRPVYEIPGAYVCATKKLSTLQKLLGRANLFFVDTPTGLIAKESKVKAQSYSGFDISADILNRFYTAFDKACEEDPSICPNDYERDLHDIVMKDAEDKGLKKYAVIAASREDEFLWTINHEIYHALFYLNSKYRKRVREFWENSLTELDRRRIKQALRQSYNVDDPDGETLLLNEFQAYTLQWGGWTPDWKLPFRPNHRVYGLREYLGDLIPDMSPQERKSCAYLLTQRLPHPPRSRNIHY